MGGPRANQIAIELDHVTNTGLGSHFAAVVRDLPDSAHGGDSLRDASGAIPQPDRIEIALPMRWRTGCGVMSDKLYIAPKCRRGWTTAVLPQHGAGNEGTGVALVGGSDVHIGKGGGASHGGVAAVDKHSVMHAAVGDL